MKSLGTLARDLIIKGEKKKREREMYGVLLHIKETFSRGSIIVNCEQYHDADFVHFVVKLKHIKSQNLKTSHRINMHIEIHMYIVTQHLYYSCVIGAEEPCCTL